MNTIAVGLFLLACVSFGGANNGHFLTFQMDRGGTPPTHYTLRLEDSGAGVYSSAVTSAGAVAGTGEPPAAATPIHVGEGVLRKLFATQPVVAGRRCESHARNVADTGKKVLRFSDGDTSLECTYNYSDDDRLNAATTLLEGIAETMQIGDRLASKLRFDRLGLDAEIDNLQTAVSQHRAVEVGNIAPVLRSIANDDRVLDRVRRKAARMLEVAGAAPAQSGTDASER